MHTTERPTTFTAPDQADVVVTATSSGFTAVTTAGHRLAMSADRDQVIAAISDLGYTIANGPAADGRGRFVDGIRFVTRAPVDLGGAPWDYQGRPV